MASLKLDNVVKSYGAVAVVKGINLSIADGEFTVLLGPSGCGKSTLLRMIAGLEEVDEGSIFIDEEEVNEVRPKDRDIAMVFQNYALYPYMTVFENIAFGMRIRKLSEKEIQTQVAWAAKMLDIESLLEREPRQLSGGQRQRVAIGRAMVRRPKIFLFDEPLSNLDAQLREGMRTEIKRLHQALRITTVYVTHDQVEAMTLADRVVLMNQGVVEQQGTPMELYELPANKFVANFLGSPPINFLSCIVSVTQRAVSLLMTDGTLLTLPESRADQLRKYDGKKVTLGLRPEHFLLSTFDAVGALQGFITLIQPAGPRVFVSFDLSDQSVMAEFSCRESLSEGDTIYYLLDLSRAVILDDATDKAIGR